MLRFKGAQFVKGGFNQVVMSISRALLYSFGQIFELLISHIPSDLVVDRWDS